MKSVVRTLAGRLGADYHGRQAHKLRVAAVRMAVERRLLAAVGTRRPRPGGRILCYHSVGQPDLGVNDITPARFRRHLELALQEGYTFVPASDIARDGGAAKTLAVTFDDAWSSVFSQARPILNDLRVPYSVFVVTDWSEHREPRWQDRVMGWRELAALRDEGVEIGSHSRTHPDFGRIPPGDAREELETSREMIRLRLGDAPASFAIPLGQSANWNPGCAALAAEAGYEVVYAQAETTRPHATVPRTFVTRFDDETIFRAALAGVFDAWEEWVW